MKQKRKHKLAEYLKRRIFLTVGLSLSLVVVFVITSLFTFQRKAYEREYLLQIESMEDLAAQGSVILEERLNGYIQIVGSLAELFRSGELLTEENVRHLKEVTEKKGLDFQRLGIADKDGISWLTNGDKINVRETSYFQEAIRGNSVITDSFVSQIINRNIFTVTVPIFDEKDTIRGVLYGVMEIENFHIYDNTSLESFLRYIRVIDRNGTYLIRGNDINNQTDHTDNLYKILARYETDISVEEIASRIERGEHLIIEAKRENEEIVIYLSPLSVNQWYVMTVMNKKDILSEVNYLLGSDIYLLILKIILAFAVVCIGSVWYLHNDKRHMENLYHQLKVNDEMVRTAISTSKSALLFYNAELDQLKVIGNSDHKLSLPPMIESASVSLMNYLPFHQQTKEQMEVIFRALPKIRQNDDFEFPLEIDGFLRTYAVHVEAMEKDEKKTGYYVGIVDDITEKVFLEREMKLQEGLFEGMIGFMVVDLDADQVLRSSQNFRELYQADDPYSKIFENTMMAAVPEDYHDYLVNSVSPTQLLRNFGDNPDQIRVEYPYQKGGKIQWMECDVRTERSAETDHCLAYIVLRDISDKKITESILKEQADRDFLTGLYNRRSVVEQVNQFLEESDAETSTHAFVILDLDNFKAVNDNLGHQMGDKALIDVANILLHHFRKYDIVCRLAGDEFVVLMKDIPPAIIEGNISALLRALHLTYTDGKTEIHLSASAGVAVWPAQGTDFASLYQNADKALYEAKDGGKQTFRIYG